MISRFCFFGGEENISCRNAFFIIFPYYFVFRRKNVKNIDKTVISETKYIAYFSFVLSVLTQAVFLVIGKWDYRVLTGNALSYIFSVLNFFLMGLTVQKAVTMEENDAKLKVKSSQSLRMLMIVVIAGIGCYLPIFNTVTVLLPLFFPRIAIALRPLFNKK